MTKAYLNQKLLLLLRSAIADKEFCIASANRENALGEWRMNWAECVSEADNKINSVLAQIEGIEKQEDE
ncbi:hypothetical protein [Neomegalonema sp.]|uniref:hypothetical protein n=1 Tax=Neomegalonema sp. TaxID=2039713 RepID=UPI002602676B|nr:hypothetical protein [Neomegalonema sp.]MDD2869637.1 hypothetical protein [Neomegalonema sp.]